jgi:hypothetical protein
LVNVVENKYRTVYTLANNGNITNAPLTYNTFSNW